MASRRKLAAILFADIAGYTKQVSEDEASGLDRRRRVEHLVKGCIATHNGHLVKTIGDAVMVEFASAVEAVSCAMQVQEELIDLNAELGSDDLKVRIGVHIGDVVEEDNDLYGNGVNIAQRVQEAAPPGAVCISREVFVQIRPILKLRCEPIRSSAGKPMPEHVDIFEVATAGVLMSARRVRRWRALQPLALFVATAGVVLYLRPGFGGPPGPPPGSRPPDGGTASGQLPGPATQSSKSPAIETPRAGATAPPFAVVGGTYAPGDKMTIGGERLGRSGTVFMGGTRARALRWSSQEIVAVVPESVRSGQLPVVVSPSNDLKVEAGTITVAPSGAQQADESRTRRSAAELGNPPEPPGEGPASFGYQDMRKKSFDRALAMADARLRENPNHAAANAMKGVVLLQLGQADKAREPVAKALKLTETRGGYVRALALLSSAMLADRDGKPLPVVDRMYRAAVQAEPDPLTFFAWSSTLYDHNRVNEAREVFRLGLKTGGNSSRAVGPYIGLADKLGVSVPPPPGGPDAGPPPDGGSGGADPSRSARRWYHPRRQPDASSGASQTPQ